MDSDFLFGDKKAWERQCEETAVRRIRAFEETLVLRALRHAGVAVNMRQARADAYAEFGEKTLSFAWFEQTHPQFPVRLGAAKIPWMHELQVGDLFGSGFMRLPFMREYQKFCDSIDASPLTDRIALLFNWPGISDGGSAMTLHNYPVEELEDDPNVRNTRGTRIVRPFGSPLVVYVVESFNDFLLSVGTDW